jgi:CRISPR/Cas system-associated protein Cas7 (RAMP superfamily)
MLEEGKGEAQYWWQQTLADIAKKRGQQAAEDLRKRMNKQKDKL